jgi:hypothetical protein
MNKELCFIIGIGRSGTTVLSRVLNTHPQLHCLPEANFLVFFLNSYKNKTQFSFADIDLIFEQILVYSHSHPWYGWWTFDIETARQNAYKASENKSLDYIGLCKLIYTHFKVVNENKESSSFLIDKNPSNTLYVDEIHRAVSSARFIWILRDYRANVLSRKQNTDLKSGNVAFNAQRWVLFNKIALRFSSNNKKNVCYLRYEDFISNTESEMERLFSFIGVDTADVTDINRIHTIRPEEFEIHSHLKERIYKHYKNWNQPLNNSRLDAWKEELNEKEIRICDAICGDFARKFGYKMHFQMNGLQRMGIKLRYAVPILKAWFDISKDHMIYYAPAALKLKRLKIRYKKLGLFR